MSSFDSVSYTHLDVYKRQPQKPNKYGIKLYMLSESDSGYIWNFSIFCGQSNVVTNIVKDLLGDLRGKGHTLFTDRYYTSPTLASELENENTALVGTTNKNRKGMPLALKNPTLQRGEQIYRRRGNTLAICWKDKRNVYMISTTPVSYTHLQIFFLHTSLICRELKAV